MQLFLLGYIIISICEIFTVGDFPLNSDVRIVCRDDSNDLDQGIKRLIYS